MFFSQIGAQIPSPSTMEWKDVYKVLEGTMPTLKYFAVTGSALKAHTKKTLECLNSHFRNVSEMEAVLRVATLIVDAVEDSNVTVELQPSVIGHVSFTDFYFIIRNNGEDVPVAFVETKNTSVSVDMGLQLKPVAQALREAQIICSLIPRESVEIPFILTNSAFWSFGLARKAGGGKISISERAQYSVDLSSYSGDIEKVASVIKEIIKGNWPQ